MVWLLISISTCVGDIQSTTFSRGKRQPKN